MPDLKTIYCRKEWTGADGVKHPVGEAHTILALHALDAVRNHSDLWSLSPVAAEPAPEPVKSGSEGGKKTPVAGLIDIKGVGPKLVEALAGAGYTDLGQIASLTDGEAAALDAKLDLGGRIAREKWVDQAKALIAG